MKDLHEKKLNITVYDIVILFPDDQIKRLQNTWDKNLPSLLMIKNFKFDKNLWKKGDYYESIFK